MKSKQCIAVEALLRASKPLRTHKDMQQELKKKRKQNSKPYKLPRGVQLTMRPQAVQIANTLCYKVGNGSKCVMYFHGGSYVDPPTPFHWRFWQHLVRETDVTVFVVMYGRTPQYHCQRTVTRQKRVYQCLLEQFGANNMIVMGDSAGGGLALALCEYLAKKNFPQPKKLVLFSPWLDVDMCADYSAQLESDLALDLDELKFWGACYRHNLPQGHYLASPLFGVSEKLAETHVFAGGAELFLPDCQKLKQIADEVGANVSLYVWEEMQHVFVMYPIPEAKEARKQIEKIIE
ncbi:MAG: alpha/beta hydrolase [Candidatus Fimimonas sp.]